MSKTEGLQMIYMIVVVFCIAGIIAPFAYSNLGKKDGVSPEDGEGFLKSVEWLRSCNKITEYQKRAKKVLVFYSAQISLAILICAVLIFVPIFKIDLDLWTDSFSLFDEIKIFYAWSEALESVPIQIIFAGSSLSFIIVLSCLFLATLLFDSTFTQFRWSGKMRSAISFAYFGEETKETQKSHFEKVLSGELPLISLIEIILIFIAIVVYVFCIKSYFKSEEFWNAETGGSILDFALSNMMYVNSVSFFWCIILIGLFVGSIIFCVLVFKEGRALVDELRSECCNAQRCNPQNLLLQQNGARLDDKE